MGFITLLVLVGEVFTWMTGGGGKLKD